METEPFGGRQFKLIKVNTTTGHHRRADRVAAVPASQVENERPATVSDSPLNGKVDCSASDTLHDPANNQPDVKIYGQVQGSSTSIVVQGNISSTWAANLVLAGALAFVCLGIAITMATLGFWMILPFAGLEVVFFTACLYWTLKRLSRKEVITIDDHSITLEWGYNKPDKRIRLPRYWSRLHYHSPRKPLDMGVVSLQAHGKRYELGTSLGRVERKKLYAELKSILAAGAA